jgi:murein DD-endopeptidase MepM/ murein hydrolase activator NlpD
VAEVESLLKKRIVNRAVQKITSPFGMRWGRPHKGVDLRVVNDGKKTPLNILLPEYCVFKRSVYQKKWGWTHVFKCLEYPKYTLKFTHMDEAGFEKGREYEAGTVVGKTVVTPYMKKKGYGLHLHLETWLKLIPRNPLKYFNNRGIDYA